VVTPACNRTVLNEETTLDVRPGDLKSLKIDPAPREQKIRVELTSTPAPVSVFVFLEKDRATAMHDIEARKDPPANVLEYREKINNATLEVTIPADSVAEVLVTHASKSTKVTLKLTN